LPFAVSRAWERCAALAGNKLDRLPHQKFPQRRLPSCA